MALIGAENAGLVAFAIVLQTSRSFTITTSPMPVSIHQSYWFARSVIGHASVYFWFKTIRVPLQTLPYRPLSLGFVIQRVEAVFAVTLGVTVLTSCETLAVQLQTLRFCAITRFFAVSHVLVREV
jgi:hypothetical protein